MTEGNQEVEFFREGKYCPGFCMSGRGGYGCLLNAAVVEGSARPVE